MLKYIGEKLDVVVADLERKGILYKICNNNFDIKGDTKLITNIIAKDNIVEITVGEFIFDIRNKKNDNK